MLSRRSFHLAGVIFIALLALVLLRDPAVNSPTETQAPEATHFPDYIVEEFTSTLLGEDGKPLYQLAAKLLTHYGDDDSSTLIEPRYAKFPTDKKPIFISAERGWMNAGETELLLTGNVQLTKGPDRGTRNTTASMETLRIYPQDDFAETDSPVHLVGQNTVADAIGMHADLANDRLILLSDVHGKQEPNTP